MRFVNIYLFFVILSIGLAMFFIYHIQIDGFRKTTFYATITFFIIALTCAVLSYLFGRSSTSQDIQYNVYELLACCLFAIVIFAQFYVFTIYFIMGVLFVVAHFIKPMSQKFVWAKNGMGMFIAISAVLFLLLFHAGAAVWGMETPKRNTSGFLLLMSLVYVYSMPPALCSLIFFHFNSRRKLRAWHKTSLANQ